MSSRLPPPLVGVTPFEPADDPPSDARILVVGGTVTAFVVTALLERTGHRPTLVTGRHEAAISADVVRLSRSTFDALATVVPAVDLDGVGSPVDRLSVASGVESATLSPVDDASPPVLVERRELRRRFRRSCDSPQRQADVTSVRETPDGVAVSFDDGSRTTFDLVVAADGPNSFLGTLTDTVHEFETGMHEWTVRTERPSSWDECLWERWDRRALLSAASVSDELAVSVRFPRRPGSDSDPRGRADAVLDATDDSIATVLGGRIPDRSTYRLLPDPTVESTWFAGSVVFCGTAATPLGWAGGLDTTLAVEDAMVLASSLRTAEDCTAAIEHYARDRRARTLGIREATRDDVQSWFESFVPDGEVSLCVDATLRALDLGGEFLPSPRG
ncbi:hypothetical protein [Haloarchaeobius salinus]|uniref:hypothetical protein n=1 Tax=Haloarchaeobius salinus TaxID=1198298 RepID=UPI00210E28C3|nr:hypothetical protein [Haloarchaeobius salinus]